MIPLGLLADGEQALVVGVMHREPGNGAATAGPDAHGSCAHGGHIADMGIRPGGGVEMLRNPGRGPVLLKVGESRIAIGRGMAMKIFVRRKG